jgi:hypothetical protein
MISSVQIEELNKAIREIATLYSQRVEELVNKNLEFEESYYSLSNLEELTKIKKQLDLLVKIRNNCIQILGDLEKLNDTLS